MKWRWIVIPFVALLLGGCLSHWFIDGDVRLQIENDASVKVARLVILGKDGDEQVWIGDTLAPGESSRVVSGDWAGEFDLGLSVQDSAAGGWKQVRFSSVSLEGGSAFAEISEMDGDWTFHIR